LRGGVKPHALARRQSPGGRRGCNESNASKLAAAPQAEWQM